VTVQPIAPLLKRLARKQPAPTNALCRNFSTRHRPIKGSKTDARQPCRLLTRQEQAILAGRTPRLSETTTISDVITKHICSPSLQEATTSAALRYALYSNAYSIGD
jgi:hypothetical protein